MYDNVGVVIHGPPALFSAARILWNFIQHEYMAGTNDDKLVSPALPFGERTEFILSTKRTICRREESQHQAGDRDRQTENPSL